MEEEGLRHEMIDTAKAKQIVTALKHLRQHISNEEHYGPEATSEGGPSDYVSRSE